MFLVAKCHSYVTDCILLGTEHATIGLTPILFEVEKVAISLSSQRTGLEILIKNQAMTLAAYENLCSNGFSPVKHFVKTLERRNFNIAWRTMLLGELFLTVSNETRRVVVDHTHSDEKEALEFAAKNP